MSFFLIMFASFERKFSGSVTLNNRGKAGCLAVLSTDPVHCDSTSEAIFGGGTKLTVLGKKLFKSLKY